MVCFDIETIALSPRDTAVATRSLQANADGGVNLSGSCAWAKICAQMQVRSPQAAVRSLANAELFRLPRSRTPDAAC